MKRLVLSKLGEFVRNSPVSLNDGIISWTKNQKEFSIKQSSFAVGK